MKIDAELRYALKAAEKGQPDNWSLREAREEAIKKALDDFLKGTSVNSKKARKAIADSKKAAALLESSDKTLESLGLDHSKYHGTTVQNIAQFDKSGGKVGNLPQDRWKCETVIAELMSADPKDLQKILKKYNIRWE